MLHFLRLTSSLCVLLSLALAIAGCGNKNPTYEEMQEINRKELAPVLEKHRAAATAKLDAIKAIAQEAKAAPPVTVRQPLPEPVTIPESYYEAIKAGVLLATVDWAHLDRNDETPVRFDSNFPASTLISALKSGDLPDSGYNVHGIDEQFGVLTSFRHLALLRVHKYDPPKATFIGGERRFAGGKAVGDVQVFDIDTRKRIGAFPFEIGQSDTANISARDEAGVQRELEQSFAGGFAYDVRAELVAFAAGKEGKAAPGAADKASLKRFADKISLEVHQAHLLSSPRRVDIATDNEGAMTVTIHADEPIQLATKDGVTRPEVKALVEKILGAPAVVKVVKAQKPAEKEKAE